MLSYAFQTLKQETYEDVAVESFDEMYNLLAAILAKGIGLQLKQGLYREYISHQEELTVMQTDIHLQRGNTVLIIDAKYYSHTTQVHFDKHTLHSNNLYQIFTYVKNRSYQFGEEAHTVSGMLLYAKTEEEIQPDNVYQMHGS